MGQHRLWTQNDRIPPLYKDPKLGPPICRDAGTGAKDGAYAGTPFGAWSPEGGEDATIAPENPTWKASSRPLCLRLELVFGQVASFLGYLAFGMDLEFAPFTCPVNFEMDARCLLSYPKKVQAGNACWGGLASSCFDYTKNLHLKSKVAQNNRLAPESKENCPGYGRLAFQANPQSIYGLRPRGSTTADQLELCTI